VTLIPHHQLDQQANQRGCGDAAEPQSYEPQKSGAAARWFGGLAQW
jgi:hypothetical protein